MKVFFNYLRDYLKEHFEWRLYLSFAVLIGIFIGFNYWCDLEDSYIDRIRNKNLRVLAFAGIHLVGYLIPLLLAVAFSKTNAFWKEKGFWIKLIIGFILLGFDRSFHYHTEWIKSFPREYFSYLYRVVKLSIWYFTLLLPLYVIYRVSKDRESLGHFYGLRTKGVDFKPYFYMLLLMVPLIAAASFLPDFLEQYPMYKGTWGARFAKTAGIPEWVAIFGFEVTYLLDFFSTEMFFRGFLILGFTKYLGKDVVLPMAATYAVFHFGKPMGETISSIFGGYILGVVALYSKNIWGGIFVHAGIAALMDLFASIQKSFN